MQSQKNLFHAEKLQRRLLLGFKIQSDITIFSLKLLSVQQFVQNFYLGVQNSVYCDYMQSQPKFHAAMWRELSRELQTTLNNYLFGFCQVITKLFEYIKHFF